MAENGAPQRIGAYTVLGKIGQGGMGAVYKANDPALDRTVAIKVLPGHLAGDEDFTSRFKREAMAAAKLNHPNVVQVYAAGEDGGTNFIAMEFVDGESLQKRLHRVHRLDIDEALAVTIYIAEALRYAWNKAQIIHRDIKPDNILISAEGDVKLTDLGLAKSLRAASVSVTSTGTIMGSAQYISPEQARGQKDVDFRTDIYSLGCTLFHMLTGCPPYDGDETMALLFKHVHEPPPDPTPLRSDCPPAVAAITLKMMAKDRNQRPASYEELIAELTAIHNELLEKPATAIPAKKPTVSGNTPVISTKPAAAPDAPTMAAAPAPSAKPRKSTLSYAIGAGVVAIAAIAGLLLWSPWKPRQSAGTKPEQDTFVKEVAALPAEEQVKRVVAELKKLNPGYDGQETHKIENGVVTELSFSTLAVADISPVRALIGLKRLDSEGGSNPDRSFRRRGLLADLSPLRGMKLEELRCSHNKIVDLVPLSGMPLRFFTCYNNYISDLGPVANPSLRTLSLSQNKISDLSPLKGMALEQLMCNEPLVKDLSPLIGMPLKKLTIGVTSVSDLSPLRGLSLTEVFLDKSPVTDLSPLAGMPITDFTCTFVPQRDTALLRSIKTLKTINRLPAAEFWKQVAAGKSPRHDGKVDALTEEIGSTVDPTFLKEVAALPAEEQIKRVVAKLKELNPGYDGAETHKIENGAVTELNFSTVAVADISPVRALSGLKNLRCMGEKPASGPVRTGLLSDLSPLRGMKLHLLRCDYNRIMDLTPLAGMPLQDFKSYDNYFSDLTPLASTPLRILSLSGNRVFDLTPLKGLALEILVCNEQQVTDLSPIASLPLKQLGIQGSSVRDLSPLRNLRLELITLGPLQTNLAPLAGMPLKEIRCTSMAKQDMAQLRSFTTLQTINTLPAAEFWRLVAAGKTPNVYGEVKDERSSTTDSAFVNEVAALPAEEQVKRVVAKLKELNPGYDGKEWHKIENGSVIGFIFCSSNVTNIAPVSAFAKLEHLDCSGPYSTKGPRSPLRDLSPLRGLPLKKLYCYHSQISDLSPLQGMPLCQLRCFSMPITNLTPLQDMPLKDLECFGTQISDLTPLRSMTDLNYLCVDNNPNLYDLTPLEGIRLLKLYCRREDAVRPENRKVLQAIPTLEIINGLTPAEFWKQVDAGKTPSTVQTGTDQWVSIFDGRTLQGWKDDDFRADTQPGRSRVVDDAIELTRAGLLNSTIVGDVAIRAMVKKVNSTNLSLRLRVDSDNNHYVALYHDQHFQICKFVRPQWQVLTSVATTKKYPDFFQMTFRATGNVLILEVDGVEVARAKDSALKSGAIAISTFGGTALFKDIMIAVADNTPAADAFVKEVAALPAEEQVKRVVAELKRLNPGYDGLEVKHKIENGNVVCLDIVSETVSNISPIRALVNLKNLLLDRTQVSDFSPLKGLKLTFLHMSVSQVQDLSPLRDMPLRALVGHRMPCRDLSPLTGMALDRLSIVQWPVEDLSPLKGMPLQRLDCRGTKVKDLTLLRDTPLQHLSCDPSLAKIPKNREVLLAIKTLITINDQPAVEFWKQVDAGKLPIAATVDSGAEWKDAINLLPLIDPARDAVRGSWTREKDGLMGDRGEFATIEIPYRPPAEYDYRVEFTAQRGGNVGAIHLAKAGHNFMWNFFGAGGHATFGFENVGGKGLMGGNPTTALLTPVEVGRRYITLVEVRNNEVRAFLDGRQISSWKTDYSDLDAYKGWQLRDPTLLGLGCQSRVTFHNAQVREVTGKGTFTRGVPSSSLDAIFLKEVAALPAEEQVKRVVAKLKELNPGYDGKEWHKIENGSVVGFAFCSSNVTNIAPVRALAKLDDFDCGGPYATKGPRAPLSDLSPLRGLSLKKFKCFHTQVSDLSPLRGMPLDILWCYSTPIRDLTPLQGMPLKLFECFGTQISDLTPLRTMLDLESLGVANNQNLLDLTPLANTQLLKLDCNKEVAARPENRKVLQAMPTIKTINGQTPAEFWKQVDTGKLPAITDQPRQTIDLLALTDPVKDRVWSVGGASPSKANRWERRDTSLVYNSDGSSGKLAPPVAINANSYEIEVGYERLSGQGRLHVDFPFEGRKILCIYLDAPGFKIIGMKAGNIWPSGKGAVGRSVIRLDRSADGKADHLTVRVDGDLVLDWKGDARTVLHLSGEPHPDFPNQLVTSLYSHKDSYKITAWTLRILDGEAKVLRDPAVVNDWKDAINLLPLIDPQKDALSGKWTISGGKLVSDKAAPARIQVPYRPPAEYDYRAVFHYTDGYGPNNYGQVCQLLSKNNRSFSWIMGAKQGEFTAFEIIAGADAANPANRTMRQKKPSLAKSITHTSLVEVRNDSLKAYLDGQLLVHWKTDYSDMSIVPHWKLRDESLLGIGSWQTIVEIEKLEVREVTGKGAFTRSPMPSVSSPK